MKRLLCISCVLIVGMAIWSCSTSFTSPPTKIQESKLVGTWTANYGEGITDTIIIADDGTFKQTYENSTQNYSWETDWNNWKIIIASNSVTRLYLYGARYYLSGIEIAERNGRKNPDAPCLTTSDCAWGNEPRLFYDPYTEELIEMIDKLILDVLVDDKNNLVLHHVWDSSDRGFAIFGSDKEIFKRIASPDPK